MMINAIEWIYIRTKSCRAARAVNMAWHGAYDMIFSPSKHMEYHTRVIICLKKEMIRQERGFFWCVFWDREGRRYVCVCVCVCREKRNKRDTPVIVL